MNTALANAYKEQLLIKKIQLELSQERFDHIYRLTRRNAPIPLPNSKKTFDCLKEKIKTFRPNQHLSSQTEYDHWFMILADSLKNQIELRFGYAQKFVNILMKDWCVENVIVKKKFNYKFLHAPIDNLVANAVCRYDNWS